MQEESPPELQRSWPAAFLSEDDLYFSSSLNAPKRTLFVPNYKQFLCFRQTQLPNCLTYYIKIDYTQLESCDFDPLDTGFQTFCSWYHYNNRRNEVKQFMWLADGWKDYEVIDCSKGEKLERWGEYLLVRPDPQVIWDTPKKHKGWKKMNGHYHRSSKGGGEWEFFDLPEQWTINYKELTFNLKPFSFKHTGLFPEQAANWDWFGDKIRRSGRPVKVLNLFAYTGGATLAAAKAGASVTHVDASKGMVTWAKENAHSSGLSDAPIRWIVDDCVKFVEREIRRGNHYDAIIMDPPSYGRGPKGEIWKIEDAIHPLVKLCVQLLSEDPLFFLINSYTTGLAPSVLSYMMGVEIVPKFGGTVKAEEVGLPVSQSGLVLPCGASGRWEK